ncbi:hypothetical protein WR25_21793 [Diploscapter pachys]|uniref:Dienelactone hydrolase domain-containing protein n=1 Tax=Diploscapter pachys TaxID=2018661 RepID=A0A2A2L274_9BILA|nr:hypothetical protein WR25_21793 [Diploscapter pachys]
MQIAKSKLIYKDKEGAEMHGWLFVPEGSGKLPGILVHHAFQGVTDYEIGRAEQIAKLGYVTLAADVYGEGKVGATKEESFAILAKMRELRTTTLKWRLEAAVENIKKQDRVDPNKIAAIGYCFGGMCSIDIARYNIPGVQCVVSFHGTLQPLPDTPLDHTEAAIMVHHGDEDDHINPQVQPFMEEMRTRKSDFCFTSHGNAKHCFTEPHAAVFNNPNAAYNKEADVRSFASMVALFEEKLKQ